MFAQVTAKNVGVFFSETQCIRAYVLSTSCEGSVLKTLNG